MEAEIKRYGNGILRYCFSILCDYHEAQDAMQETFAKAFLSRGSLKSQEKFGAWLYKIAYNTCLNMKRGRKGIFPVAEIGEASAAEQDPFIAHELREALLILSPQDRALFYSRAVEDTDYNELEALYNARAATLRKRYERAKNKLKIYLTENGYEGSEWA